MVTRSTSYGRHVGLLLAVAILSLTTFTTNGQKLKLGIRSGVSLANYIGHNASGPGPGVRFGFSSTTSYYDLNGTRTNASYKLPNPYYETSLTKDLRTGFYAGVFLEVRLGKRFSLEPGIAYVQKGIDMNFYSRQTESPYFEARYWYTRSINTNYISLPIVAKYYLDRRERFYIVGGVYDAFVVKTKVKNASIRASQLNKDNDLPLVSTYFEMYQMRGDLKTRLVDCGLVGGAGFTLPAGARFSIGVDARLNLGLISLQGDSDADHYVYFSSSAKNINLETGLRIAYAL